MAFNRGEQIISICKKKQSAMQKSWLLQAKPRFHDKDIVHTLSFEEVSTLLLSDNAFRFARYLSSIRTSTEYRKPAMRTFFENWNDAQNNLIKDESKAWLAMGTSMTRLKKSIVDVDQALILWKSSSPMLNQSDAGRIFANHMSLESSRRLGCAFVVAGLLGREDRGRIGSYFVLNRGLEDSYSQFCTELDKVVSSLYKTTPLNETE